MSTQTEISRIQTARNTIRTKLVEFGLVTSTAKIEELAAAVKDINNNGSVTQTLNTDFTSYPIDAGYHDGTGEIKIELEEKGSITPITPTKETQVITPSSGKVLSKVTVAAIPDAYQDVSDVETPASAVLNGYIIVNSAGDTVIGSMPDNGAVRGVITPRTEGHAYPIEEGYHNGNGFVMINMEDTARTVTPSSERQYIVHPENAFIKQVVVNAIPDHYTDVSGVTTTAENVLEGTFFINSSGTTLEGAMPNNGDVTATITGLTDDDRSVTIDPGYTSGGKVSLTNDIENALKAI